MNTTQNSNVGSDEQDFCKKKAQQWNCMTRSMCKNNWNGVRGYKTNVRNGM